MNKKLPLEQYSAEELADAFVFPVKLSAAQRKEADKQLAEHRKNRRETMPETEKLKAGLAMLKFRLEDYIKSDDYQHEFTFGYFLEQYLQLTKRKKKEFAKEINIHETQLSQMLNDHREPNDIVMVRLELHSNNMIPAVDWFKLVEKSKEHQIRTDRALREKERPFVTHDLQLV